jgi:hypothetical protein
VSEERQFAHVRQVAAVAAATLVAECAIVYGCLHGFAWEIPLAAHFAVIAGLAAWRRWSPGLRADVRLPLLLAAGTAALGPLGAAGTLATMFLTRWYARKAIPFEEWYQSLFPDTRQQAGDQLAARIASVDLANPGSLTPFAEILAFGSLHQKQALIALINQQFRPAFGPILKRALTDGNNAVRVQAATAMNKLENAMLERTLELSHRTRENPGNVQALRALARHYDDYLYSGGSQASAGGLLPVHRRGTRRPGFPARRRAPSGARPALRRSRQPARSGEAGRPLCAASRPVVHGEPLPPGQLRSVAGVRP